VDKFSKDRGKARKELKGGKKRHRDYLFDNPGGLFFEKSHVENGIQNFAKESFAIHHDFRSFTIF
jgi:hypothetical protein